MAQFYTDFSGYSTGSFPQSGDDWTVEYPDDKSYSVVSDQSAEGSQIIRVSLGQFEGRDVISWDSKNGSNVEVVVKTRANADDVLSGPSLRGGGGAESSTGYFIRADIDPNNVSIRPNDRSAAIASTSISLSSNTWYWIRFRANGNDLKGRVWEDGNSEPSAWDIELTDSDYDQGWSGIHGGNVGGAVDCDVDSFGVGTEGDTAPMEPAQAPAAPTNLQLSEQ